jgi:hypothetical protein
VRSVGGMQRSERRDLNFKLANCLCFLLSLNLDGEESGQVWISPKDFSELMEKTEKETKEKETNQKFGLHPQRLSRVS